ncbi:hypothetical protein BWQ96_08234 [Gracilariopsis chorda]|uniref:Uncharacterized protein n=1 Tax=Gracilariopsis chorda TaxID=448386 RepID=A0A2V3IIV8_9FLOR|nr:hypothetical protein BWQ96_08233 [Gracilariopsis chorda]PXF42026.1 hypothetical protein BWQ96_08234 [Gracilariopsis chorda]|eukprot:PXF42025.1 hypothetical protein BWQ96_08233 [Gracilariopsis chorda]
MKLLILCFFSAFLIVFSASAARVHEIDETDIINEECDVPPVVAYCLDMIHLGSNFKTYSSQRSGELQQDVDEVPVGMCAWGDWAGKLSANECVVVLKEYAAAEEEEDGIKASDPDTDALETTNRFLPFRRGFRKFVKKVGKRVKKSVKRVGRTVRKVARFCRKRKLICEGATELGIALLPVPGFSRLFNMTLF